MSVTPAVEPRSARRREFVQAFVDNARPFPGAERRSARPHILVLVAVLASAGAVGFGAVSALLHPRPAAPARVIAAAPPGGYVRVSGWDCVNGDDHGFTAAGRNADWYTVASGGWAQDGCHGTFEAIPMTGSASTDDANQFAVWWFVVGEPVKRCDVFVYVPKTSDDRAAGGAPAQFYVLDNQNGTPYAAFTLSQAQRRGEWVPVGSYPVNHGQIAIKLVDRGVPARPGAHLAVAQVRVSCSG